MLQPFVRFAPKALHKLIEIKHVYVVSQSYHRACNGPEEEGTIDILLSDYGDEGLAKIHLNAVSHDKYASIIRLNNEKHLQQLNAMMEASSKYRLFWNVVPDAKALERQINKQYEDRMRKYIDNRTNWSPKGGDKLKPSVQVTFGELYITLKHGSQTLRIKFEEIEAM